jgi:DNA-binding response OmpR family regulator
MKVLIVDDDPRIREALEVGLQLQWEDAHVLSAADGETGLELFFQEEPEVVLLDINMPRMNGFEVLKEIRRVSDVPVIMLTARDEDVDQVRGLELGADDYVPKPFSHPALMARIKAVLRRAEMPPPVQALPDFTAGDLAIHFQNQEVTVAGDPVKLTPVEYKLLYHLVRNAGHLMPHQALLDRVWGSDYEAGPEYLKVFVSRLRAKLRRPRGPEYIETERGRGYRFVRPRDVEIRDTTRQLSYSGNIPG